VLGAATAGEVTDSGNSNNHFGKSKFNIPVVKIYNALQNFLIKFFNFYDYSQ
jgi:hypothetical protein